LEYSAGGKKLATGGFDNRVREWDIATGQQLRDLPSHVGSVQHVAYDDAGQRLVAVGLTGVAMWSTAGKNEGTTESRRIEVRGQVSSLAALSRSNRVAAAYGDSVVLLDAERGTPVAKYSESVAQVRKIAVGQQEDTIVSIQWDGRIQVRQAADGQTTKLFQVPSQPSRALLLDESQDLIVGGGNDGVLYAWQYSTGRRFANLKVHARQVQAIVPGLRPKEIVSSEAGGFLKWSDLSTGAVRTLLQGQEMQGLARSPLDDTVLIGMGDGSIVTLDLRTGKKKELAKVAGRVYGVAYHPTRPLIAAASSNGNAFLIDQTTGEVRVLRGHRNEVNTVAFSVDGSVLLSGSDDETVRAWSVDSGWPRWYGTGLVGNPPMSYGHLGWNGPAGTKAPSEPWLRAAARGYATSYSGAALCVITFEGKVEHWSAGQQAPDFVAESPAVDKIVVTKNSCLTLSSGTVRLVGTSGSAELAKEATAISADSSSIMVATQNGVASFSLDGVPGAVTAVAPGVTSVLPRLGQLVLGYADGTVEVRGSGNNSPLLTVMRETSASSVSVLALGPSETLLVGYVDGTAGVWSLKHGRMLHQERLTGAVVDIVTSGGYAHVASELGDRRSFDLRTLEISYCDLLEKVWATVPYVWEENGPVRRARPSEHPCYRQ
jgi:WD40 repeat protein